MAQIGRVVLALVTATPLVAGRALPARACACVAGGRDTAAASSGGALGWAAGVGVLLMAGAVVFVLYRRLRKPGEPKDPDQR